MARWLGWPTRPYIITLCARLSSGGKIVKLKCFNRFDQNTEKSPRQCPFKSSLYVIAKDFARSLKKVRSDQSGNKHIRFQLHYTADNTQSTRFRLLNLVFSLNVSVFEGALQFSFGVKIFTLSRLENTS